MLPLNLLKNDFVVIALHSDFVYRHKKWPLLIHVKQRIQYRISVLNESVQSTVYLDNSLSRFALFRSEIDKKKLWVSINSGWNNCE